MKEADLVSVPLAGRPGLTAAQSLFLDGFFLGQPLCSGLGRCGLCRARYEDGAPAPTRAERRKLGAELLSQGWRLTCQHPAAPARLLVPRTFMSRRVPVPPLSAPVRPGLVLAVDLGTTSIEWRSVQAGQPVASGRAANPQMGAGSDVMARIAFAAFDHGLMRSLILSKLKEIIASLPGVPERLCLAGNPAMTLIALGRPLAGLARAPYQLDYAAGEELSLAPDLPPVYVPPLLGPFVGGDLSAGLTHLLASRGPEDFPFILADFGTNGEFVLALSESEFLAASVPLGPALEGAGLSHGGLAGPGLAVSFTARPAGLTPRLYEDKGTWNGRITGTGYLSLAAALIRLGLIGRDGRFVSLAVPDKAALAARLGLRQAEGEEAGLAFGPVTLLASDLEELLKIKAACNTAIAMLCRAAGIAPGGVCGLELAGALGYHVNIADLEELGLIPPGMGFKTRRAGNASLAGAMDLLTLPGARDTAGRIAAGTKTLDLALDPDFERRYLAAMVFDYAG